MITARSPWFLLVLLCACQLSTRELDAQTQQSPAQPIELPEFIVTGKEQVGVPGAAKQAPLRPPMLAKATLDSLNPVDKLSLPPMAEVPLPEYSRSRLYFPGWVSAELGNYMTPSVSAGYSLNTGGYMLDAVGKLQLSNGWVNGSEFLTGSLGVRSSYVAPEEYVVFGGSETRVALDFASTSYKLYALQHAPSRNVQTMSGLVATTGKSGDYRFDAQVDARRSALNDADSSTAANNQLHGTVTVVRQWDSTAFGGFVDVMLPSYRSQGYSMIQGGLTGSFDLRAMHVSYTASVQTANSTMNDQRFGVGVSAKAQWQLGYLYTVDAQINSGLRLVTMSDIMSSNPYVSSQSTVDVPYDLADVTAGLRYHPTNQLTIAGFARLRLTDRDLVWSSANGGVFTPQWLQTSTTSLHGSVRWWASHADAVTADLTLTHSTVDSVNTPYVPAVQAAVGYERAWTDKLSASATIIYIGERYVDVTSDRLLDGYVDVRLAGRYTLNTAFDVFVRAENLVGSTMVIWDGYIERGVFVSAGLTWRF